MDLPRYDFANGVISISALTESEANSTCKAIGSAEWQQARVAKKFDGLRIKEIVDTDQRDALAIHPDFVVDTTRSLLERVFPAAQDAVRNAWEIDVTNWSSPQFTKYYPGHFIKVHRDSGEAFPKRLFTTVLYLTDDYTGGEIHFPHIQKKYHPASGTALIFPSDFVHEVRPLEVGTKCVFLFFLEVN